MSNVQLNGYSFTYTTPALEIGRVIYIPEVGDVLLDIYWSITTAFDGTTPFGDIGQFLSGNINGWFGRADNNPVDMTEVGGFSSHCDSLFKLGNTDHDTLSRYAQDLPGATLIANNPLQIVVNQTGTVGGSSSGSTMGAATVWLLIAHASSLTVLS